MTIRLVMLAFCLASAALAGDPPPQSVQWDADQAIWKEGTGALRGTELWVLEGNPQSTGFFTMRVKLPAGFRLRPHWHPVDERVTVISGAVQLGFGDVLDFRGVRRIEAGGFYMTPAKTRHFLATDDGAIVQVSGKGPMELLFVSNASDVPDGG